MTNEEALKICRLAKAAIAVKHDPNNDANDVESMMRKMQEQIAESADLDIMIAIFEKQIPLKPEIEKSVNVIASQYKCCVCGGGVYLFDNYCSCCGQRIDWRDDE